MSETTVTTYGPGGFDPTKSDGNVKETRKVSVSPEVDVQDTLHERARGALAQNQTFLAIGSPTAAQNAAQVKALTRQVNALIRLQLGQFDSSD